MTRTAPSAWVTWLVLLAFLLQGLVAQTHVHTSTDTAQFVQTQHSNQPAPKAPADCPVCQLQAATSAVIMPHAVITFLSMGWVEDIALVLTAIAATTSAHQGWQSRAPPQG